ncbi:MAG TPA: dipeptide/oligopeptide/nickel ABC transporter permease/ATP-binding protein [Acidimicrobiales bacterium]|nr:dipeptide/oligopeptide/nickel ABC transporter permease/ATP-binding protein [Acidimicrobiales bacterium]
MATTAQVTVNTRGIGDDARDDGAGRMRGIHHAIAPLLAARGLPRWIFWTGAAITLFFVVLAVFAPQIAPYGFNQYIAHGVRFPQQGAPSAAHWMGTTVVSEDVFSRVIFGARTSIEVVVLALAFSVVIGVPLGLVSGYFGGWVDRALVLFNDSIFAFPYLLLAIVIAFLLQNSVGGGVFTAAIAITVVYIPQYFRVVRNSVLSVREESYVEAGRALGAKPRTVIRRYVFANVIQSVPVVASLNAADAILTLAGLSFLGIGMDPSVAAEWGYDISRGISDAQAGFWWTGLFPGIAIILLVTGLTLVGEGLNDSYNPLMRRPNHRRYAMPGGQRAATTTTVAAARPVVRVRDLRVWYGTDRGPVRAVDGVSFEIRERETLGLVGESGCGKSTLGRGLLGLLPAGATRDGVVDFAGRNLVEALPAEMRKLRGPEIGLVFQEPMTRLDPLMRISDHFAEALRTHEPDISDAEVRRRSLEALGGVGIPPTRFRNYPYEFSGGMRQRIMIALALVFRPRFVIADEPTTALDVLVEAQILSIIADLKQNFDASLLLITHNLGIVAESCDRVAVMYAGRIVEQGAVDDIFRRPEHPYTQELMRSTISLSTRELHFIPGAPPDLIEPPSGCRFHPRCPSAMRICADDAPIGTEVRPGHLAECWLHGPFDNLTADRRVPLEREVIGIADEA